MRSSSSVPRSRVRRRRSSSFRARRANHGTDPPLAASPGHQRPQQRLAVDRIGCGRYCLCWCPTPPRSRCRSNLRPPPTRAPSAGCAPSSATVPDACPRALFVQVRQLAREMGVLKMGTVALDGTKIHANASRHSALSGYVTHLATDEAPEDGENGFAYWPTAMDRQRETDRGENKAAEGKNRHGRHIRQQRADREHDQTERQHVGPRILNPKVLRRSPGFAGVGASVMLSCQEGESPTDVKSWHM